MDRRTLPPRLKALLKDARVKRFPAGQILLYEGDQPTETYVLKSGVIKLHSIDSAGSDKILHLLKAGNILPLAFFSGLEATCQWYYTALTDCEVYVFSRNVLEEDLYSDETIGRYFTNNYSEEVHELLTRLDSLSKTDSTMKLASLLRYLAVCHSESIKGSWRRVTFPVNHQLLADMIGMSRESTSIGMKEFAIKKIVRNPRTAQLEIHLDRLIAYRTQLMKP